MAKFDKFKFKVWYTTKKSNLSRKIKSKYIKYKLGVEANVRVLFRNLRNWKNSENPLEKVSNVEIIEREDAHKLKVSLISKSRKIKNKAEKYIRQQIIRIRANVYIRLRKYTLAKHKFINKTDKVHDVDVDNSYLIKTWRKFSNQSFRNKERQVALFVVFMLVIYVSFESTIFKDNAYKVYADDQLVGVMEKDIMVDKQGVVEDLLVVAEEEVGENAKLYDREINKMNIEFVPVRAKRDEVESYDEVLQTLSNVTEVKVEAYEVVVNGESIGIVPDVETYKQALDEYTNRYIKNDENTEVTDVIVQDDIILSKKSTYPYKLKDKEYIIGKFSESIVAQRQHEVIPGDTIWQIAFDNDMTEKEVLEINPQISEKEGIHPGDMINLVKKVPRVSVAVTEVTTFTDIAYRDIKEVPNDKEYRTYRKTVKEGSDGKSIFTVQLKKVNGEEVRRQTLEEKVLVEPVTKVIEVGTMNTPPKRSTGQFVKPAYGRRTDNYGTRGGTHKGIDIAAPSGTPIYAADGGVVKFSGWYGGYGNLVIINHENGFETYYGHNSKNYVSAGQRVYQGQNIAAMGTTGDSTGNHSHFEVRINGVPVNPDRYLK